MYAQRGHGKRSSYYSDYTFGLWREEGTGKEELVPVGKAYFGFTDQELAFLDRWIRNHTTARFGPVREVEKAMVLEVAFDAAQLSTSAQIRGRAALPSHRPHPHRQAGGRGGPARDADGTWSREISSPPREPALKPELEQVTESISLVIDYEM